MANICGKAVVHHIATNSINESRILDGFTQDMCLEQPLASVNAVLSILRDDARVQPLDIDIESNWVEVSKRYCLEEFPRNPRSATHGTCHFLLGPFLEAFLVNIVAASLAPREDFVVRVQRFQANAAIAVDSLASRLESVLEVR